MFKILNYLFFNLDFDNCNLFEICYLLFEIYKNSPIFTPMFLLTLHPTKLIPEEL